MKDKNRDEMLRSDSINSSSKMNSKLLFLPLRELQEYMNGLEMENERLRSELSTVSRLNCILENVRRSSNKGFNAMQCIDRNKCCRCNEHLNGHLRRMAQEADIELRVWQEQYDKLIKKGCVVDDGNKVNGYSRLVDMSTNAGKQDVIQVDDDSVVEKPSKRLKQYLSNSNESRQHKCTNGCKMCLRGFVADAANRGVEPVVLNHNTKEYGPQMLTHNSNSNDSSSSSQYISIPVANEVVSDVDSDPSSATSPSSSRYDSSPPLVVFDSSEKSSQLMCEWPNCRRLFTTEDDLVRHRRNHIRKSIYHCEYCSARILNKEDLDNHMITNHSKPNVESEKEVNISSGQSHSSHDDNSSVIEISSDKSLDLTIDSEANKEKTAAADKSLYFPHQTVMRDRLDSTGSSMRDRLDSNGSSIDGRARNAANLKPEDYKRTRYSGIGRYRCPWPDCGYTPHFLRDLRRHMHKHTGDKKHKCDYPGCDFVSVWKTSLLQHQRKKHFAALPQNDIYS